MAKKKYMVLLGDGMADRPIASLGQRTPLEVAHTPALDFIAQHGVCGFVQTVPKNFQPGSDIANMSLLGYSPEKYYTGRAPLEAASMNIDIPIDKIAFRCNFVTMDQGIMKDFTAGHISTEEAGQLIAELNAYYQNRGIQFFTGVSYRHIALVDHNYLNLECTPPHDITDQSVDSFLPKGQKAPELIQLMEDSKKVFSKSEINRIRLQKAQKPVTQIWLWGQGEKPKLPLFKNLYGLQGGLVTAVGLLKGIGQLIGFKTPEVPGATGFLDTNYQGKVDQAIQLLEEVDFVYLHVEAPDETGHMGDVKLKIQAIEDFSEKIVAPILAYHQKNPFFKILVVPDHPTPCELKTHSSEAVPFAIYDPTIKSHKQACQFSEKEILKTKFYFEDALKFFHYFLQR